jgi:hypothetical protein
MYFQIESFTPHLEFDECFLCFYQHDYILGCKTWIFILLIPHKIIPHKNTIVSAQKTKKN